MPVPAGHTLGPYRIESQLGAGGMGEVYKATDTKLGRAVALKLLPSSFASDPERLARFQREARTLAALNHPHIAQVYDAGTADGATGAYIAMELVEGEDLSQRIRRGPLPLAEAIAIARQIIQALDAAHERGIVHRDLKPANIKVRDDGMVKVLDFGLAKAIDQESEHAGSEDPASEEVSSDSPTTMSPAMTSMGMILGTAGYMSPEQAKGRPVDKRADIWAFGVVLYEMLTGTALFTGETVTEVVAAVIRQDISLDALPPGTPPGIRATLTRCLERDPRKRLRDIGDLDLDANQAATQPSATVAPTPLWQRLAPWAVATVGILATWLITRPAAMPSPAPIKTSIDLPPGTRLPSRDRSIALSPDGRRLAIVLEDVGTRRSQLHIRALDSSVFTPLEGTADAIYPFWSPDGSSVGFFANREMRRFDFPNGPARTITTATQGRGADWGADDTIIFVAGIPPDLQKASLYRVNAEGRTPAEAFGTHVTDGYAVHSPNLLPGDGGFLLSRQSSARTDPPNWQVVDTRTGAMNKVLDTASEAQYAEPGWLLFVDADNLLRAQAFDAATRTASGRAQAIGERVGTDRLRATANVTQAAGTLVYWQDPPPPMRQLAWYDLNGGRQSSIGDPARYEFLTVSPDGRRAIVAHDDLQLWLVDLASGGRSPFFVGPGRKGADVIWSPNGREVAFRELGSNLIVVQEVDNPSMSHTIGKQDVRSAWAPSGWTPDGKTIILSLYEGLRGTDVVAMAADGSGEPRRLVATPAQELGGCVTPDGRWLAYISDESGTRQAYVTSYPKPGAKITVTTGGAEEVQWLSNTELMVRDPTTHLTVLTMQAAASVVTVAGRRPALGGAVAPGPGTYSIGAKRLLIAPLAGTAGAPSLVVVTNWTQTLRR
jgi:eukaryotic-like serine/threonine-protein kinase